MTTEVEIGVMWPQAEGCLGYQEAGRNEEGSPPRASGQSAACSHLDFSPGILISDFWPPVL